MLFEWRDNQERGFRGGAVSGLGWGAFSIRLIFWAKSVNLFKEERRLVAVEGAV